MSLTQSALSVAKFLRIWAGGHVSKHPNIHAAGGLVGGVTGCGLLVNNDNTVNNNSELAILSFISRKQYRSRPCTNNMLLTCRQ